MSRTYKDRYKIFCICGNTMKQRRFIKKAINKIARKIDVEITDNRTIKHLSAKKVTGWTWHRNNNRKGKVCFD